MAFHNRKNAAAAAAAPTTTETTTAAQTAASVEPQPQSAPAEQPQPATVPADSHPNIPTPSHPNTPARRTKTDRSKLTAEERAAIRERRLARQAEIDALDPAACAAILQAMLTAGSITLTECETTYKATGDTRRVRNEIKRLGGTWTEPIFEADGKTIKEAGYWNLPLDALTDPTTAAQRRLDQRAERAAEREERRTNATPAAPAQPSPFDGLEFWDGKIFTNLGEIDNQMISMKAVFCAFGPVLTEALKKVGKTPKDLGNDYNKTMTDYLLKSLKTQHDAWLQSRNK